MSLGIDSQVFEDKSEDRAFLYGFTPIVLNSVKAYVTINVETFEPMWTVVKDGKRIDFSALDDLVQGRDWFWSGKRARVDNPANAHYYSITLWFKDPDRATLFKLSM